MCSGEGGSSGPISSQYPAPGCIASFLYYPSPHEMGDETTPCRDKGIRLMQ